MVRVYDSHTTAKFLQLPATDCSPYLPIWTTQPNDTATDPESGRPTDQYPHQRDAFHFTDLRCLRRYLSIAMLQPKHETKDTYLTKSCTFIDRTVFQY